ncbi:MAG: hypothetical protein NVV74_12505 [Magnetospirillum sp.]|nr:hypothetical protein [Magnetospirillum sp.]
MVNKIKIHIFFATMVFLFGWYYLVDTLPRSRLIPAYLDRVTAAAAEGRLAGLAVEQPGFYLDNPMVSVRAGAEGGYEIVFAQASKRRCEQLIGNAHVKQTASRVLVTGDSCRDVNEVILVMARP